MNPTPIDEAMSRLDGQLQLFPFRKDAHRLYIARPNQAAQLLDRSGQERAVLDDACKKWVAGSKLPVLAEADLHLLYDRFGQAHVFGAWVRSHVSFQDKSATDILRFLLFDHWYFYGQAVWVAQMSDFVHRRVA